jgi:hypothetical protein
MADATAQTGLSDNAASGLAYVTIIPAVIFLVVAPYNQNPAVKFHCWQSIFLGIGWVVVWIALAIVGAIPFLNIVDKLKFNLSPSERSLHCTWTHGLRIAGFSAVCPSYQAFLFAPSSAPMQ